jgi:hypothetical protein
MSLTFPYHLEQTSQPVVSLDGRTERPRPVVTVGLIGTTGTWPVRTLLDTGADDCIFPADIASRIGVDLTNAPTQTIRHIAGAVSQVQFVRIQLRLSNGQEFREWPAWVGFTSSKMRFPVLGYSGCLQYFTTTFHGDREQVELTINGRYPGT